MANPVGPAKNCPDADEWDVSFRFTVGAAGVVTLASLPEPIKSIARTANAGEYLVTLREKWNEVVKFSAQGISATVNRGHLTVDAVKASGTFTFVTLVQDGGGVQAAGDLANGVVVAGEVTLRNVARS